IDCTGLKMDAISDTNSATQENVVPPRAAKNMSPTRLPVPPLVVKCTVMNDPQHIGLDVHQTRI
ncbi:MAG: hypothetical protein WBW14_29940, partial [Candidatus Acidiferrum sp.]